MRGQLAELGDEPGYVVLRPGRRPPRDQDDVGRTRGIGDRRSEPLAVVGQGADDPRQAAVAVDQRPEHHRVHVGDLDPPRRRAVGEHLVARDDDRDLRPAHDGDFANPHRAQDAQVLRPEHPARTEHDGPGGEILARAADVPPDRRRLDDPDGLPRGPGRLDLHHGVGPPRDR